jgi:hypothetical protein
MELAADRLSKAAAVRMPSPAAAFRGDGKCGIIRPPA